MVEEEIRCKCVICAEVFDRTNMTALYCGHVFHEECMQRWLEEHTDTPTCPTCRASINKDLIVRRLFFEFCDDENAALMVALRETEFALSRAEAEIQELNNDKKEVEDKLALELGKVASFGVQIHNQNRQLDEATNLQKELIGELCGEREELKILRSKESDSVLRIRDLEEQLKISKKNEDDSKLLVKNLEEQLRISKKNQNDSKLLIKDSNLHIENLEEQLRISKKNENDLELLVKNLEEQLRISKKNHNDPKLLIKDSLSDLHVENSEEQLKISKKNESDPKLLVKNLEEQLRISKKNENDLELFVKEKVDNLEAENNNLNRQLDEERKLQKKLTKELNAERDQLRILKEKIVDEHLKTSKKMEALVKSVAEVLKVLDKGEADLKMLTEVYNTAYAKLRCVQEQLKNLKTKENDSGIS